MAENHHDWDANFKYISFAINTSVNQTTGETPFKLMFGREPNIPSTLVKSSNLTYQNLIRKGKQKHDELIEKAKQRMEIEMENSKKRQDEETVKIHPLYK